jgi:site-specific DNA recombinase
MKAAIYCRVSNDAEGREAGVGRQEVDCRALAESLGYEVSHVYVENDVGASTRSRKPRPQYGRLIDGARNGLYEAIIAYSNSRLTRRPREYEDLIDLFEKHGVRIRTCVSGAHNLGTADGRAVARTIAAWDAAEAERTSERVQRAFLERAQQGKRHGFVPYGWHDAAGQDVLSEGPASVIRETARRLLALESLRSVVEDLNARGVPSPRGLRWNGPMLRQIMLRERNAGRRVHRGQVIGMGEWEPVLDDVTHDRVVALLKDPNRVLNHGAPRRYLLSGIAKCGKCGGVMRGNVGKPPADGRKPQPPAYVCPACFGVRRRADLVDKTVVQWIVARLQLPDAPKLFGGNPDELAKATAKLEKVRAKLALAADQYADDIISGDQMARISKRLRPTEEAAAVKVRAAQAKGELAEFVGPDAERVWGAASLESRRGVITRLVDVTILPTGSGGLFIPASVRLTPRQNLG